MSQTIKKSNRFSFSCFGVQICIESNRVEILEKLKKRMNDIFPVKWEEIENGNVTHQFKIFRNPRTGKISVYKNEETVCEELEWSKALDAFISKLRLTVAEFAKQRIFLHAGVVGWRKKAIIIPGRSFAGKTTLVAELAKNGCEYFSDEYALLDKKGLVHPYPKKLSLRGIVDDYTQVDVEVEKLGGRAGVKPLPVGFVLLAEYKKNGKNKTKPEQLSLGEGIMGCIANSISIRQDPKLVIEVLNRGLAESTVLKARRGEVDDFVKKFLSFLDKNFK
jgi:hypothetical protein